MIITTSDSLLLPSIYDIYDRLSACYGPKFHFELKRYLRLDKSSFRVKESKKPGDASIVGIHVCEEHDLAVKVFPDEWENSRRIYSSSDLIARINACGSIAHVYATNLREPPMTAFRQPYCSSIEQRFPSAFSSWEVIYRYNNEVDPNIKKRLVSSGKMQILMDNCIKEIQKAEFYVIDADMSDFVIVDEEHAVLTDLEKLVPFDAT